MKFSERAKLIVEELERHKTVSVQTLSEKLDVSLVTVRKDLQRLEEEGRLVRTFGGAACSREADSESRRIAALHKIADCVVEVVCGNDSLLLNAGTTTKLIARNLLRFQRLRVITNSVYVARTLSQHPGFQLILLGGEINTDAVFTYGRDAISQLEQYKADKLIMSASGISHAKGLTTRNVEATDLLRQMIERSKKTIIVADEEKIGFESFYRVCDVHAIDKLVTNRTGQPDKQMELQTLERTGIEICLC